MATPKRRTPPKKVPNPDRFWNGQTGKHPPVQPIWPYRKPKAAK